MRHLAGWNAHFFGKYFRQKAVAPNSSLKRGTFRLFLATIKKRLLEFGSYYYPLLFATGGLAKGRRRKKGRVPHAMISQTKLVNTPWPRLKQVVTGKSCREIWIRN